MDAKTIIAIVLVVFIVVAAHQPPHLVFVFSADSFRRSGNDIKNA